MQRSLLLAGISLAIASACSGTSITNSPNPTSGGSASASSGGVSNVGGINATTQAPGNGGNLNTGGVMSTGGVVNTGGIAPTGGAASTGGKTSTGGNPPTGGNGQTGGAKQTGCVSCTGGTVPTGGKSGTGGVAPTGGKASAGGSSTTGGVAPTGGMSSAGGSSSPSTSTSSSGCSRAMLQSALDSYLAAVAAGSAATLPSGVSYKENNTTVALTAGLWASPLKVDLLPPLTALDVDKCQTYSELIIDNNHKYILGARLTITAASGQISAINVLVTDCPSAWAFNADTYLKYSKQEQDGGGWGPVASADQLTRQELMDAGKAYFAYWSDTTVQVPWGYPCSRLEGGAETNPTGDKNTTCSVGIPANTPVTVSDQLVDVDYGMVVDFLGLPGPDSHWFRVNKDASLQSKTGFDYGITYVHTLTNCMLNGKWQCPSSQPTCTS